jgi:hypothetical protein
MYIGKSETLTDLKDSIINLKAYFQSWTSQKVKYSKYYEMRASHKPAIDQLKSLISRFLSESTEAKQEEVSSLMLRIEALELRKITDELDRRIKNYVNLDH